MNVDQSVVIIGLVLAGLTSVGYIVDAFTRSTHPQLNNVVSFFLAGTGAAAGGKLGYCAICVPLPPQFADDWLFVLIGGIAVVWVSISTMAQPFLLLAKNHPRQPKPPKTSPAQERRRPFKKR